MMIYARNMKGKQMNTAIHMAMTVMTVPSTTGLNLGNRGGKSQSLFKT